jgi:glycosyltransferase involved in cell wall biosynthesis
LRILMTTDAVGGVWVYSAALTRELCRLGHRVTLVTLGPPPDREQLRPLRGLRGLDLVVTDLALEWMDPYGTDVAHARDRLAAIEDSAEPDVVHVNGYRDALRDWSAPVLVAAHSCVRSWWRACRGGDPPQSPWGSYTDDVQRGLAAADAWVAPTTAFRDTITELYAPPMLGQVIWNGSDCRARGSSKEPVVLAAGRLWDEAKNVATVLAAAPGLLWPTRVAGPLTSGPQRGERQQPIEGVHALGPLSRQDLLVQMRRAPIFVAAAVYEPFGLTVLEAALSGCALVLSDIASFRELWDGAALFVDPRDAPMLHGVLAQLVRNQPLRDDLQRRALRRARRYSLAAMTDRYLSLYATLARHVPADAPGPRGNTAEARP